MRPIHAAAVTVAATGALALGVFVATSSLTPEREQSAVAASFAPTSAKSPRVPTAEEEALTSERQMKVNEVLDSITRDFPDDYTGAWKDGATTTVAFAAAAPPEAVRRLDAMGYAYTTEEGLGVSEVELIEIGHAIHDRAVELAGHDFWLTSGPSVQTRDFSITIGPSEPLADKIDKAGDTQRHLGITADEFARQIEAAVPAARQASFSINTSITDEAFAE